LIRESTSRSWLLIPGSIKPCGTSSRKKPGSLDWSQPVYSWASGRNPEKFK
jgi:hypothetical protein